MELRSRLLSTVTAVSSPPAVIRIPASKQDEHKYGGAITYAKRYSLMLALGLGGDEDVIEQSKEEDLPTVVEAKEKAEPKKAPARKAPAKKRKQVLISSVACAGKRLESLSLRPPKKLRERFKAFAKGCRNRKDDPRPDVFEEWLVNNFGEQKNV